MKTVSLEGIVIHKEAQPLVSDMIFQLEHILSLVGRSDEPEVWAEECSDGSLVVYAKIDLEEIKDLSLEQKLIPGKWEYKKARVKNGKNRLEASGCVRDIGRNQQAEGKDPKALGSAGL